MVKLFKGFNLHFGTKAEVKQLRDILAGNDSFVAQNIVDAIDAKVLFDDASEDAPEDAQPVDDGNDD